MEMRGFSTEFAKTLKEKQIPLSSATRLILIFAKNVFVALRKLCMKYGNIKYVSTRKNDVREITSDL